MTDQEVANEIWRQMNALDRNLVWCMGTKKPTCIKQGLAIQVSGLSFKGTITITLNAKDLYDVKFLQNKRHYYVSNTEGEGNRGKRFTTLLKVKYEYKDIFFDGLMPLLESVVEARDSKQNAITQSGGNI